MKKEKIKKLSLLIVGLFALIICALLYIFTFNGAKQQLTPFFSARAEDKVIVLNWYVPAETVDIIVIKDNKHAEKLGGFKGSGKYYFTDGDHGKNYYFKLEYTDNDGQKQNISFIRKFLDFTKLPDMEILYIDTEDGQDPTYTAAKKPDKNLFGVGISNNDYKNAKLNNDIPVKIKIRGNVSAYRPKKSYKIVLKEKKDLLNLGKEYADTEWVLLGKDSLIRQYFGLHIGMLLGMNWEPRMRFVNLMLNGNWKGLYILCESIKVHPKRVAVKKDGFLIESDVYFWKEKAPVVTSPLLSDKVKFVFKYPKFTSNSDKRLFAIGQRIKKIDDAVKAKSENIGDLIDFDTFAGWGLAHEMMGTMDGYGSNAFFYQYDKNSKLKMGPLWDFDTILSNPSDKKATFLSAKTTYVPLLLEIPGFREFYKNKYFAVAPSIEQKMKSVLEKLKDIPGLEQSIAQDDILASQISLDGEIKFLLGALHDKIVWLNEEFKKF